MEGLIVALQEETEKGFISGIKLPKNGPTITSLHYADDNIFLGKWNESNVRNLMKILNCFHLASGLKINWNKSTLNGTGISTFDLSRTARDIGCKVGSTPFRYLGLPIGENMHKIENWRPLLEKFDRKLSVWKAKTLSAGGRLCLCKAGLWEYTSSQFLNWVAWDVVLNARDKGGLGIGSLRATNLALLAKWWWRFKNEEGALWRKVMVALHGETDKIGRSHLTDRKKGTWGNIAKQLQPYCKIDDLQYGGFQPHFKLKIFLQCQYFLHQKSSNLVRQYSSTKTNMAHHLRVMDQNLYRFRNLVFFLKYGWN
ncbi:LOW QUALITY PROTEIN: hypothetical protein OSB04_001517 [Centaurea solstitialis]|uniref:Reverse transcriptase domain-containing protein n=1 Tax=Centaurea solstitialis TaxID=347529 RepID=A0AA38WUY9_9ASTR|nr:LOW QUALITY PROTEIN: hypothetical protein OSB04_001517 [Centaurea solstitialis]